MRRNRPSGWPWMRYWCQSDRSSSALSRASFWSSAKYSVRTEGDACGTRPFSQTRRKSPALAYGRWNTDLTDHKADGSVGGEVLKPIRNPVQDIVRALVAHRKAYEHDGGKPILHGPHVSGVDAEFRRHRHVDVAHHGGADTQEQWLLCIVDDCELLQAKCFSDGPAHRAEDCCSHLRLQHRLNAGPPHEPRHADAARESCQDPILR